MSTPAEPVLFAAEYESAEPRSLRRVQRAPVSLDARIGRGGLDRALCKVTNLSQFGARLQTYSALKRDALIWLTLKGEGPVVARVRWANDFEAGCEFEVPLDSEMFAALTAG